MFERLAERARRAAERRVEAKVRELADRARAELPRGIVVEAAPEGVLLSGRGLARRTVLDPALRWMAVRLAQDGRL